MSKIQSFFKRFKKHDSGPALSTPTAVIIGSIIISAGIVGYGYVSRPAGPEAPQDLVKVVAKELKLKGSAWDSCLTSQDTIKQVQNEENDGIAAGVSGTPTSFILVNKNGKWEVASKIEGAQPEQNVRQAIDKALAGNVKTTPFTGAQLSDSEFVKGTKGNVVLLEYADAQCPYCVRFQPTVEHVIASYGDRVGFVYRHFPLTQIHPNAMPYAIAIECAGKLKGSDAYFSFSDKLFNKELQGQ